MNNLDQNETPFLTALDEYVKSSPASFDVPGHKGGKFKTDLDKVISSKLSDYDYNFPIGLDNLYHAKGVLLKAEQLAAKAMHADNCLFSVNGTSGAILSILMAILSNKDKIILPRNVHKSVINSLIISGAVPIFVNPEIDSELGIAKGVKLSTYVKAMDENPTAKAIFVINPTYFGCVSNLKEIVKEAHKRNMIVVCDEAHGSNFYFSEELPLSAMDASCDISAVSMHKNSGSLTQTSFILSKGNRVDFFDLKKTFAMFGSTSPNHLLLCSLDAARKEMYFHGEEVNARCLKYAEYAREELNKIPEIKVYGKEYAKGDDYGAFNIDLEKLVIDVRGLNKYGYEVYKDMHYKFNVQLELGEVYVVLAIIGPGTTLDEVNRLIAGFKELAKQKDANRVIDKINLKCPFPKSMVPPREAFDAPYKTVDILNSIGEISHETVMAYPPGIPLVIPGEVITKEVVDMVLFYNKEGGQVLKDSDDLTMRVIDKEKWYLFDDYNDSID